MDISLGLALLLSHGGGPSLTAYAREHILGVAVDAGYLDGRQMLGARATAGADLGDGWRIELSGGRAWWDEPAHDRASVYTYALGLRVDTGTPWVFAYRHYSTGKRILGEQTHLENPSLDLAMVGYTFRW